MDLAFVKLAEWAFHFWENPDDAMYDTFRFDFDSGSERMLHFVEMGGRIASLQGVCHVDNENSF